MEGIPEKDMHERRRTLEQKSHGKFTLHNYKNLLPICKSMGGSCMYITRSVAFDLIGGLLYAENVEHVTHVAAAFRDQYASKSSDNAKG